MGIELLYKSDDILRFPMNKQYPDDERQKILTCIAVQALVDSLLQIDIMRVASEVDDLYLANIFLYYLLRGDHIDGASELYRIIHATRLLFQVVRPCTFQIIT